MNGATRAAQHLAERLHTIVVVPKEVSTYRMPHAVLIHFGCRPVQFHVPIFAIWLGPRLRLRLTRRLGLRLTLRLGLRLRLRLTLRLGLRLTLRLGLRLSLRLTLRLGLRLTLRLGLRLWR